MIDENKNARRPAGPVKTKESRSQRKNRRIRRQTQSMSVLLFLSVLFLGGLIGLLFPLRPSVSESEKRTLTKFPVLSVSGMMDGSFFGSVSEWYSDTYPFRDLWLDGNTAVSRLKGIQTVMVIEAEGDKDDIPDLPMKDPEESSGQTDSKEIKTSETELSAETETSAETVLPAETAAAEETVEPAQTELPAETSAGAQTVAPASSAPAETTAPTAAVGLPEPLNNDGLEAITGEAINGLYTVGDRAYEIYYFNRNSAETYISLVNRAAADLAGQAQVSCMLIPTASSYYLSESVRASLQYSDEEAAIRYYYACLSDSVLKVPVYETLAQHTAEYIYFRTDHHWTGLGAYYAYQAWAGQKGMASNDLSLYQAVQYPGFLGSFYSSSKAAAMESNPDTLTAYIPLTYNRMTYIRTDGQAIEWNIINDVSGYTSGNKYSCFAAGDNPISYINNPNVTNGKVCLVIKESFGNALIPYLTDHYSTIYWIDYRTYNGDIIDFAKTHSVCDLIFANGMNMICDSSHVNRLNALIP